MSPFWAGCLWSIVWITALFLGTWLWVRFDKGLRGRMAQFHEGGDAAEKLR